MEFLLPEFRRVFIRSGDGFLMNPAFWLLTGKPLFVDIKNAGVFAIARWKDRIWNVVYGYISL